MTKHIPHFEGLRGVAALWVFISHVLLIADLDIPYLRNGDQAVDLFIILSGFVIALMRMNEREDYPRYLFRRFMRIYPLFLIALMYGAATDHLYAPVFGQSPWLSEARPWFEVREANLADAFWQHLLLHLTMIHGAIPDTILAQSSLMFSGPLWSISLEWQFYLVAPLLIAAVIGTWRRSLAVGVAMLVVALLVQYATTKIWSGEVPSFLPIRLPLFIVGILCAALWHQARAASVARLAVFVALAFIVTSLLLPHKLPLLGWFVTYFAAAVYGRFRPFALVDRVFASRPLRSLGEVSYGLYVLHVPTMMLISYYLVFPMMGEASAKLGGVAIASITLPIVLLMAWASYTYIERPLVRWARTTAAKSPTILPARSTQ